MSNVAVRHVPVFGNMSNDLFILSTCRNKLNMFNFFRHVERRMPQVACCFDMLFRHVAGVDGAVRHVECRMLQVACCFDMLPVAVRHVAGVDGALDSHVLPYSPSVSSAGQLPREMPAYTTCNINLYLMRYQLHSVEGRAKCRTVPQRRELVTGISIAGQDSK